MVIAEMSAMRAEEEQGMEQACGSQQLSVGQEARPGAEGERQGAHLEEEAGRPTTEPAGANSPSQVSYIDITTGRKDNSAPGHEQSVKTSLQQPTTQPSEPTADDSCHSNGDANGVQTTEEPREGDSMATAPPQNKSVSSDHEGNASSLDKPPSQISLQIKRPLQRANEQGSHDPHNAAIYGPYARKQAREPSFIKTVQQEVKKIEKSEGLSSAARIPPKKKIKKSIFVSYSPDANFSEKKFVVEVVRQLKENNLSEDIWFDKDEKITDSPCWFSLRMEALEKSKAVVVFVSASCSTCPVSVYEKKVLLEKQQEDPGSVRVFLVNWDLEGGLPAHWQHLGADFVDVSGPMGDKLSTAERASTVVGALMVDLEKCASVLAPSPPSVPPDSEFTGNYRKKRVSLWNPSDLQEWLFNLGIKEFYRQSLAEQLIDGFLLLSLTDTDMSSQLAIDSQVVRRKITQQVLQLLDKEQQLAHNWHLRARGHKAKGNNIYLIYDPNDVRLAQNFKHDLAKAGLQVLHHTKLGGSKEEFLRANGPLLSTCSTALVLLTDSSVHSPFLFQEVLFADWLGKKLLTAVFSNMWFTLRPCLKAVLGGCPAVDFESRLYNDSLYLLQNFLKPRQTTGIIFEQSYLSKMTEGVRPLALLAQDKGEVKSSKDVDVLDKGRAPGCSVFISHQWDVQQRVEWLQSLLEANQLSSWADTATAALGGSTNHLRNNSGTSNSGTRYASPSLDGASDNRQGLMHRNLRASTVVLCCITPKYLQSDSCIQDLILADSLNKPIIPVLFQFCTWPPEGVSKSLRKVLIKYTPIDLSNNKLFRLNVGVLLDKLKKTITSKHRQNLNQQQNSHI